MGLPAILACIGLPTLRGLQYQRIKRGAVRKPTEAGYLAEGSGKDFLRTKIAQSGTAMYFTTAPSQTDRLKAASSYPPDSPYLSDTH